MQSSLFLQMLLYYHVAFSFACFFVQLLLLLWKRLRFSNTRIDIVTPVIFVVWALAEAARLYSGYVGNLFERLPSLVAFLFLSFFPTAFVHLYLLFFQDPLLPIDVALGLIHVVMLVLELVVGYALLRQVVAANTARFAVDFTASAYDKMGTGSDDKHLQERQRREDAAEVALARSRASWRPNERLGLRTKYGATLPPLPDAIEIDARDGLRGKAGEGEEAHMAEERRRDHAHLIEKGTPRDATVAVAALADVKDLPNVPGTSAFQRGFRRGLEMGQEIMARRRAQEEEEQEEGETNAKAVPVEAAMATRIRHALSSTAVPDPSPPASSSGSSRVSVLSASARSERRRERRTRTKAE